MKKTVLAVAVAVAVGVLLSACVTSSKQYASGRPMPQEQVDRIFAALKNGEIKIGMSKEEVINLIGEPSIQQSWGGSITSGGIIGTKKLWKYTSHSSYYSFVPFGAQRPLLLLFDKDGRLIEIGRLLQF